MTELSREKAATVIDRLRDYWTGRRVLLLVNRWGRSVRAAADELATCGATVAAVVAGDRIAPDALGVPHVWNCSDHGLTVPRRNFDTWLHSPPDELAAWLDGLDLRREFIVLGTSYTDIPEFCGRPVHGWWRPEWAAWEDKTVIDELWSRLGVPAPPCAVLSPGDPELAAWAARLDRGRGVMIATDNTEGILGSSKGLRWVRGPAELEEARRAFAGIAKVRLAAYLPGTPFSILGMVLPDGVAVFEPFEIVTLRRPASADLVYGGTSTWWRADPEAREKIRSHTRTVGEELASSAGFRGMFSVDGIATGKEFAATELNPRHVSGLSLWAGWPDFPVRLFGRAVQEQALTFPDAGWRDIEDAFCEKVRENPAYVVKVPLTTPPPAGTGTLDLKVQAGLGELVQTVTYTTTPDSVQLLGVDPLLDDRSAAPAAAALGAAFGRSGLVPFHDDSVRSSWTR